MMYFFWVHDESSLDRDAFSRRIWQKKWGKTAEGSLEIDPTDTAGTYGQSPGGQGGTRTIPGTTKLTMNTPL